MVCEALISVHTVRLLEKITPFLPLTQKSSESLVFFHIFHFAFMNLQSSHHFFNCMIQDIFNLQEHQTV